MFWTDFLVLVVNFGFTGFWVLILISVCLELKFADFGCFLEFGVLVWFVDFGVSGWLVVFGLMWDRDFVKIGSFRDLF